MKKFLYHVTTKENLQRIMEGKGITGKKSWYNLFFRFKFNCPKAVYLSNHPMWLAVITMGRSLFEIKNELVILKINVDGLELNKEYNHPSAYYFIGNISKKRILDIFYLGDLSLTYEVRRNKNW